MRGNGTIFIQLKRVACALLALHFLNCSIDPRDIYPDSVPEDLAINDIESLSELLAEEIFGFSNAFAEHDEDDADAGNAAGPLKLYFNNYAVVLAAFYNQDLLTCFVQADHLHITSRCREVSSPPPEV